MTKAPNEVHPRIRGEYSLAVLVRVPDLGSPPHTRGILAYIAAAAIAAGFTPAYAGNTYIENIERDF